VIFSLEHYGGRESNEALGRGRSLASGVRIILLDLELGTKEEWIHVWQYALDWSMKIEYILAQHSVQR